MSKPFEKAWELAKAAPCPQCGAETGDRCGRNPKHPANRCKLRRRAMERANRPTDFDSWGEDPVQ